MSLNRNWMDYGIESARFFSDALPKQLGPIDIKV